MCEYLVDPHVFGNDTHCDHLHQSIEQWASQDSDWDESRNPYAEGVSPQEAASLQLNILHSETHLDVLFLNLVTELFVEHICRGLLKAANGYGGFALNRKEEVLPTCISCCG